MFYKHTRISDIGCMVTKLSLINAGCLVQAGRIQVVKRIVHI